MPSFLKINPHKMVKSLQFIDVGNSCSSREFLMSQIGLLMLFAKNKILAKIFEFTVPFSYIVYIDQSVHITHFITQPPIYGVIVYFLLHHESLNYSTSQ